MKTTTNRSDRFLLSLAVCCGLFGFTFSALRAEGGGVGGANLPPPKAIVPATSSAMPAGSILLSNGTVMLPDGSIVLLY